MYVINFDPPPKKNEEWIRYYARRASEYSEPDNRDVFQYKYIILYVITFITLKVTPKLSLKYVINFILMFGSLRFVDMYAGIQVVSPKENENKMNWNQTLSVNEIQKTNERPITASDTTLPYICVYLHIFNQNYIIRSGPLLHLTQQFHTYVVIYLTKITLYSIRHNTVIYMKLNLQLQSQNYILLFFLNLAHTNKCSVFIAIQTDFILPQKIETAEIHVHVFKHSYFWHTNSHQLQVLP